MFSSTCRFEEADETDLPFIQSPEAVVERLRIISSLSMEGSRLLKYNNSSTATSSRVSSPSGLPAAEKTEAHRRGVCRPCGYFSMKADSCRQGDACDFCHICTLDEARAMKRQLKAKNKVKASNAAARIQRKHTSQAPPAFEDVAGSDGLTTKIAAAMTAVGITDIVVKVNTSMTYSATSAFRVAVDIQHKKQTVSLPVEPRKGRSLAGLALDQLWLKRACAVAAGGDGLFPPNPRIELLRRSELLRLRRLLDESCRRLFDDELLKAAAKAAGEIDVEAPSSSSGLLERGAPREAFNRWLMERMNAGGADPLLGGSFGPENHRALEAADAGLQRDILAMLPLGNGQASSEGAKGQCRNLRRFALAMAELLALERSPRGDSGSSVLSSSSGPSAAASPASPSGQAASEDDSDLLSHCLAAAQWAASQNHEDADVGADAAARLVELRYQSRNFICRRFALVVKDNICSEISREADRAADRIAAQGASARMQPSQVIATLNAKRGSYVLSLSAAGTDDDDDDDEDDASDLHSDGSAKNEPVERGSDFAHRNRLCANSADTFTISSAALTRLGKGIQRAAKRAVAAAATSKEPSDSAIDCVAAGAVAKYLEDPNSLWVLAFCILCRYDSLCGPGGKEGGGFHAAVPASVFETVEGTFGSPCVECFASPLLCRGGTWRYCSLFNDLDVFCGSMGSFLKEDFDMASFGGVYEVNPPFIRGVVLPLAEKILSALSRAAAAGTSLHVLLVLPGLQRHSPNANRSAEGTGIDVLDRLLGSPFAVARTRPTRRPFTYGLAFKTDRAWPPFVVPTTLAVFGAQNYEADRSALAGTLRRIRTA
ncbi:unnamed protein product [Polarella glacialis]|uniref:PCIF1 WW domain-containing protein n=1 Tax=Polarella glacialis TaxID=89957 RepID=A0A813FZ07_POLGL|nr:unnamed protein product [Polarella glacialis]